MLALKLILLWLVLSFVFGTIVGRCIRFGMGEDQHGDC